MMFLEKKNTLSTCKETDCTGCDVTKHQICHFSGKWLALFLGLNMPVFAAGVYLIASFHPLYLIPWFVFIFLYFGLIEIRVMCSHCPHYAEPELKSLKCWANYGSPKIWKYRPGPMSIWEKLVFFAGLAVIFLSPLVFALLGRQFIYAGIYSGMIVLWKILLQVFFCRHCINLACPLNAVKKENKKTFLEKNPVVKEAWKGKL